ncbi:uncharacterized protein LOC106984415 [Acinonyx jubatus]|uniref:Uncharacterized protein LOC106984415 n=1 Tax=Acinonyx jubatus TaxID=32536 RepID=A0A6J1ZQ25_ACIJB|nr:uncharacterized protein LOC106984415 [Acinonyx jubatus]
MNVGKLAPSPELELERLLALAHDHTATSRPGTQIMHVPSREQEKLKRTSIFTKSLTEAGSVPWHQPPGCPWIPLPSSAEHPQPSRWPGPRGKRWLSSHSRHSCDHTSDFVPPVLNTLHWLPISICVWSPIRNSVCDTAPGGSEPVTSPLARLLDAQLRFLQTVNRPGVNQYLGERCLAVPGEADPRPRVAEQLASVSAKRGEGWGWRAETHRCHPNSRQPAGSG